MKDFTLGLDLGPASIGWALIETEFEHGVHPRTNKATVNPVKYHGFLDTSSANHPPIGVRIFEAGLDNFGTVKEKSLNQARRESRSMRRRLARRGARKRDLKRLLIDRGFLPDASDDLDRLFLKNPYELRARAVEGEVTAFELGRAIYHLAQRRGFRSNRKTANAKEDEGILKEMSELQGDIDAAGYRTLGQYLFRLGWKDNGGALYQGKLRIRGRHTRRDMYLKELDAIVEAQITAHRALERAAPKIKEIIFRQHDYAISEERRRRAPSRANLHRSPQVRTCPLEPTEKCIPRSDWLAQRFRNLKEVNNLKYRFHGGNEWFSLNDSQRQVALSLLESHKELTFSKLRKELSWDGSDYVYFNLERGGRTGLKGNIIDYQLSRALTKKEWAALAEEQKQEIRDTYVHEEDAEVLEERLGKYIPLKEKLDKLIDTDPEKLEPGYMAYSRLALTKIMAGMEQGIGEYEAIVAAYPDTKTSAELPELPALIDPTLPQDVMAITNPVVKRTLTELRRVVNAIVREHGKPRQIVVEMAREMKLNSKARKEYNKELRSREAERKAAAVKVEELGGNSASRDDILRYMLWEEQEHQCIYSGKPIPQEHLFSGELDVDHILPRWQSLDDSQVNKVLCYRVANRDKGQATPVMWLGQESQEYIELLQRAVRLCERNDGHRQASRFNRLRKQGLSPQALAEAVAQLKGPWPARLRRMMRAEIGDEAFTQRQLRDTQFIARAAVKYLQLLYPEDLRHGEKAVRSTKGGLTAELRHHWRLVGADLMTPFLTAKGLHQAEETEGKSRADHRHHAVDAVVVALSSRRSLKNYSDFWKGRNIGSSKHAREGSFPEPWPNFRESVGVQLERMFVSHKPSRRIAGAFHEDTTYGTVESSQKGQYVTRKSLDWFTKAKQLAKIRDNGTRGVVEAALTRRGWNGEAELPKDWTKEPLWSSSGVKISSVRVLENMDPKKLMVIDEKSSTVAATANNHHLAIYRMDDGTLKGTTVPQVLAAHRVRIEKAPIVERTLEGGEFVMSLSRRESVLLKSQKDRDVLCFVQKLSGSPAMSSKVDIFFKDARNALPSSEEYVLRLQSTKGFSAVQKVQVDPLGRVSPAGD